MPDIFVASTQASDRYTAIDVLTFPSSGHYFENCNQSYLDMSQHLLQSSLSVCTHTLVSTDMHRTVSISKVNLEWVPFHFTASDLLPHHQLKHFNCTMNESRHEPNASCCFQSFKRRHMTMNLRLPIWNAAA